MNTKDLFMGIESDLYEEILVQKSLDQYEGLLNHSSNERENLKGPSRKRNTNY